MPVVSFPWDAQLVSQHRPDCNFQGSSIWGGVLIWPCVSLLADKVSSFPRRPIASSILPFARESRRIWSFGPPLRYSRGRTRCYHGALWVGRSAMPPNVGPLSLFGACKAVCFS
jgi:hypothetical protein